MRSLWQPTHNSVSGFFTGPPLWDKWHTAHSFVWSAFALCNISMNDIMSKTTILYFIEREPYMLFAKILPQKNVKVKVKVKPKNRDRKLFSQ